MLINTSVWRCGVIDGSGLVSCLTELAAHHEDGEAVGRSESISRTIHIHIGSLSRVGVCHLKDDVSDVRCCLTSGLHEICFPIAHAKTCHFFRFEDHVGDYPQCDQLERHTICEWFSSSNQTLSNFPGVRPQILESWWLFNKLA